MIEVGRRVRVCVEGSVYYGWEGEVVDHDRLPSSLRGWEYAVQLVGSTSVTGYMGAELEAIDKPTWLASGSLNDYAAECHTASAKWWHTPEGVRLERNAGELLMLMVSELAEAMEGVRKDCMDDKIPGRKMVEVELADALIRIFDFGAAHGLDLQGAYEEKMSYNASREDHTYEARALAGGKKF